MTIQVFRFLESKSGSSLLKVKVYRIIFPTEVIKDFILSLMKSEGCSNTNSVAHQVTKAVSMVLVN